MPVEPVEPVDILCYHAVAFLDHLGQSEAMTALDEIPDPSEVEKVIPHLRATIGVLRETRQRFRGHFETLRSHEPRVPPGVDSDVFRRLLKTEVSCRVFSDSLIASTSLAMDGDDDHCGALNGIHAMLGAAGVVAVAALAEGNAIRGAIETGWGVIIEGDEIYGSALQAAYVLESKHAEYPRVVLGERLMSYVTGVAEIEASTPGQQWAKILAELCLGFVTVDPDDGRNMINLRAIAESGPPVGRELLRLADASVAARVERFADHTKLGPRYRRLLASLRR